MSGGCESAAKLRSANKLTALVGRQEERDLVDVYFLEQSPSWTTKHSERIGRRMHALDFAFESFARPNPVVRVDNHGPDVVERLDEREPFFGAHDEDRVVDFVGREMRSAPRSCTLRDAVAG